MPFCWKNEVTRRLTELLGPSTDMKGMWGYAARHQLPFDAFVTFSDETRECCVELPGTACGILGDTMVLELVAWSIGHGGKPTRCDLRIDFHGYNLGLIDTVRAACEAR